MTKKTNSRVDNIHQLLKRAERLKEETEALISDAKEFSTAGMHEMHEIVDIVKANWVSFTGIGKRW